MFGKSVHGIDTRVKIIGKNCKTRLILSFDLCHLKHKKWGGDDVIKHDSTEAE